MVNNLNVYCYYFHAIGDKQYTFMISCEISERKTSNIVRHIF